MKNFSARCFPLLSAATLLLAGCSEKQDITPSIAAIAVNTAEFQILEDAAVRGGVVPLLSNKNPNDPSGNFTVFAPNNAAFARLGLTSAADLNGLQKGFLTNTLYYHVASGNLPGSGLTAGSASTSALKVDRRIVVRTDGTRYVNGSRLVATDVAAANGTIHVIDKVLLATGLDIVESAMALSQAKVFVKPELTFLVEAVLYAELDKALSASPGSPQLTVFAPTDQAFRELGTLLGVPLVVPADIRKLPKATVQAVLLNHVVAGSRFTPELPENAAVPTLGGGSLRLGPFAAGTLTVQGAGNAAPVGMAIPDVQCVNGIVHVIDRVLLP
ncbi:fasciclin domain-containing protein [Hymenobacter psychrophilus]|uniref:Uncaracterized surface protein containing fasciclin (FAS1) repeats n=1 Tax=Hymenobacter psychrophilus TaxID=651662 RepID=A0A1H3GM77_9BACT|nr:fasciclin domain-containing protein [Hymenobacter psychrophilus]SDY04423.1 Uncaracterized surface protein containing fasciclin (FAS1) repeats [Hymenobacter psychrophilus]